MNSQELFALALSCGASLAGIANADILRLSPSHQKTSLQTLPKNTRTVLVLALYHPTTQPELDYWGGKGATRGNLLLIRMADEITRRAEAELGICAKPLEYRPTDHGTFLKDAAVLAGMGIIGKNNLLITPEYGPLVRLKALALEIELPPTEGRADFAPCSSCSMPCLALCPQTAFPNNRYDTTLCRIQMQSDVANAHKSPDTDGYSVTYCRTCEFACPVGTKLQ